MRVPAGAEVESVDVMLLLIPLFELQVKGHRGPIRRLAGNRLVPQPEVNVRLAHPPLRHPGRISTVPARSVGTVPFLIVPKAAKATTTTARAAHRRGHLLGRQRPPARRQRACVQQEAPTSFGVEHLPPEVANAEDRIVGQHTIAIGPQQRHIVALLQVQDRWNRQILAPLRPLDAHHGPALFESDLGQHAHRAALQQVPLLIQFPRGAGVELLAPAGLGQLIEHQPTTSVGHLRPLPQHRIQLFGPQILLQKRSAVQVPPFRFGEDHLEFVQAPQLHQQSRPIRQREVGKPLAGAARVMFGGIPSPLPLLQRFGPVPLGAVVPPKVRSQRRRPGRGRILRRKRLQRLGHVQHVVPAGAVDGDPQNARLLRGCRALGNRLKRVFEEQPPAHGEWPLTRCLRQALG